MSIITPLWPFRKLGGGTPATPVLLYGHTDTDDTFTMNGVNDGYGQVFTPSETKTTHHVDWKFGLALSPVGAFTAFVYAESAGVPTGAALASSGPIDASTIATGAYTTFTFTTTAVLTASTTYVVTIEATSWSSGSHRISIDGSAPNGCNNDGGGGWSATANNGAYVEMYGI